MKTLEITPAAMNDYRGSGKAWGAIKDGKIIAIRYMHLDIDDQVKVETPDRRFKGGVRVSYKRLDTSAEFAAHRERCRADLAQLGDVVSGMASCGEFVQDEAILWADTGRMKIPY